MHDILGTYTIEGMGSYLRIYDFRGAKTQIFVFQQNRLHNRVMNRYLEFDLRSSSIWMSFISRTNLSPPQRLIDILVWLRTCSSDKNLVTILRMERNSRLHSSTSRLPESFISEVESIILCHLDLLSRQQKNLPSTITILSTWFSVFQAHLWSTPF
ncbi:hypothetical protein N665_0172s0108 [Sinapis alba]|nr:hypothetical protein N665_0172s0108 [Sinapis alba]